MPHANLWFRCALLVSALPAIARAQLSADTRPELRKASVSTTLGTLTNFESEETNLHHYEFHLGYRISRQDRIGLKFATWKLFEPMGIPMWNSHFRKESEWYPGRLREVGIGVTYQRLFWKGLFAQVEALPLKKTYLRDDKTEIGTGFKLYTSYHLGYQISMLRDRIYFEPQVHCNYWPVDTDVPPAFREKDRKWNNYFLFEPNVYIGIRF